MNEIQRQVTLRLAKELREAGWEECALGTNCYWHPIYGTHCVFDATFVQRDAAELLDRGWKLRRAHNTTYFCHPQLGLHAAHAALLVQQEADAVNGRQKLAKWLCFLLFVALMGYALYLFMGV
jgi:hypothetical protein